MLLFIILAPFFGFLINATLGRRLTKAVSGGVAVGAMLVAFGLSVAAAAQIFGAAPDHRVIEQTVFTWMTSGDFSVLRRQILFEGEGPCGRRNADDVDIVFEQDGHAIERAERFAVLAARIGRRRLLKRIGRDADHGVQRTVVHIDAVDISLGDGRGGRLAGREVGRDLRERDFLDLIRFRRFLLLIAGNERNGHEQGGGRRHGP